MATLKGLILTLKMTRNFWDALLLKNSKEKKRITFRNGFEMELNWIEYRIVRDILSNGYTIEQVDGLLSCKRDKIEFVGPLPFIGVLNECLDEVYNVDCDNKVVLDVGGFIGDTAVFFSKWGAKKVIIYEPVRAHHKFIKINTALNGVNAEIHEEGIGDEDGYMIIHYDTISTGFGFNEGKHEMKIKIRNVRSMIEGSNADIAKFDCEGAEESLTRVPKEVLRKIDFYMIEVHTPEIKRAIIDKFKSSGFDFVKDYQSVVFFQKI